MRRETYRKMKEMGLDSLVEHLVSRGLGINELGEATFGWRLGLVDTYASALLRSGEEYYRLDTALTGLNRVVLLSRRADMSAALRVSLRHYEGLACERLPREPR